MKNEKSTLLNKLKAYSASVGTVLSSAAAANAQVVYTDISPDTTLNTDQAQYILDLNNDGTGDYTFTMDLAGNGKGAVMTPGYSQAAGVYNAVGGSLKKNAFDGNYGYPYVFSMSEKIDTAVKFFDLKDLLFQYNNQTYFFPAQIAYTYKASPYGNWFGVEDMYMPLRITKDSSQFYGWVRCSVSEDGQSIKLKDYAYNPKAGQPVFAGQGDPTGINAVADLKINIYAYDGILNIIMDNSVLNNAQLELRSVLGQIVKNVELSKSTSHINVSDLPMGVYIATVYNDGKTFSVKIALTN
ncbi:MAG: T9SS type A sorting domain-containing protein [Chitinophagales bacterium]|nr:T9SS type A sorting domain-containing protein [Chitinophagales bacterium]